MGGIAIGGLSGGEEKGEFSYIWVETRGVKAERGGRRARRRGRPRRVEFEKREGKLTDLVSGSVPILDVFWRM